jgi:hypothetical protein
VNIVIIEKVGFYRPFGLKDSGMLSQEVQGKMLHFKTKLYVHVLVDFSK